MAGFELGRAVNGAAEWTYNGALTGPAVRNPVIVALLLTAIALILVYVVYRPEGSGHWRSAVRYFVYLFIAASALVFVHYYAQSADSRRDNHRNQYQDFVDQVHRDTAYTGAAEDHVAPVPLNDRHGLRWQEDSFLRREPSLNQRECAYCPLPPEGASTGGGGGYAPRAPPPIVPPLPRLNQVPTS